MRCLTVLLFFLGFSRATFSQCTSGCCAPGTANFGVLDKGDLLFFSFFKRDYSDTYFKGDRPTNFNYLTNDYANYGAVTLSYGVTPKFTVQGSIGYYLDKIENFNIPIIGQQQLAGKGLSDIELFGKYNIYHSKNDVLSITLALGAKLPTGPYKLAVDNVELTRDVQPGSGAYSGASILYLMLKPFKNKKQSIMFNSRVNYNGVNPQGYRYGVENINSLFTVFKLYKDVSLIVMLRNENKESDVVNNVLLSSSSSTRLFASPGITINMGHELMFSLYGDFPFYQYYSGIQLAAKYAFSVSFSKVFEFHEKPVPTN
jgi:hypothetical protein